MDQVAAIAEVLTSHGISSTETSQIIDSLQGMLQSCPDSDSVKSVVKDTLDQAFSYWLLARAFQ